MLSIMTESRRAYYEELRMSFFLHRDNAGVLDLDYEPDKKALYCEAQFYRHDMPLDTDDDMLSKTPWGPVVEGKAHAWREWMRFKRKERITFATDTKYIGYYDLKKSVSDFNRHSVDHFESMTTFRHLFMMEATTVVLGLTRKGGDSVATRHAALWFATLCFNSVHFWRNVPPVWTIFKASSNLLAQAGCCFALRTFCADTLRAIVTVQRAFKRRKAARTIQWWWNDMFYNPHYGVFVSKVGKVRFKKLVRGVSG